MRFCRHHCIPFTAVLGLLASGLIAWEAQRSAAARDRQHLERLGDRLELEIARRMRQFEYGLRGASALWPASQSVERHEFVAMVRSRDLEKEFPGALGLGFIRRVPNSGIETFLATTRADGATEFTL